jgi:predicted trehalose synthase
MKLPLAGAALLLAPLEMIETLEWRTEQARRVTSSRPASQQALRAFSGGAPALVVFVHGSIEGRARYSGFHRIRTGREP